MGEASRLRGKQQACMPPWKPADKIPQKRTAAARAPPPTHPKPPPSSTPLATSASRSEPSRPHARASVISAHLKPATRKATPAGGDAAAAAKDPATAMAIQRENEIRNASHMQLSNVRQQALQSLFGRPDVQR